MRDPERVRRSNMVLIGLVILCLLYGIIVRMQSGDKSFYLFGFKIYGAEETQAEEAPQETSAESGTEENGR
ncbi:MAG: hypothetical protein ACSW8K_08160 [bacterium]